MKFLVHVGGATCVCCWHYHRLRGWHCHVRSWLVYVTVNSPPLELSLNPSLHVFSNHFMARRTEQFTQIIHEGRLLESFAIFESVGDGQIHFWITSCVVEQLLWS